MNRRRQMLLFPVLLLILTLLCYVTAFADDAELLAQLPGNWTCPGRRGDGSFVLISALVFAMMELLSKQMR